MTITREHVSAPGAPEPPMRPSRYVVTARRAETYDTVTLMLRPAEAPIEPPRPGQFTMLYVYGVGEVPVSVSGFRPGGSQGSRGLRDQVLVQTIRAVGAVTRALCAAAPGDMIGVRGPFGTDWQLHGADGRDMLVVAGGIGLAPLRPVLLTALAERARYDRVVLLVGARSPDDLIFTRELETWRRRDADVRVTVDHGSGGWTGQVGLVTRLIDDAIEDPADTAAFVCGPEIMMRLCSEALVDRGVPATDIRVSLERNMRCGAALCGHCQLGPLLLCRDGPVVSYADAAPLTAKKEL
jgi:anaerobic sulfite reductase subunit B